MNLIEWHPRAVARRTGLPIEQCRKMGRSKRRALMDPEGEKRHLAELDAFLAQVNPKAFHKTFGGPSGQRPAPMKPETRKRLDRIRAISKDLEAADKRRHVRERSARIAKLLDGWQPKPPSELDTKIQQQLKVQPPRHRATLNMLYRGAVAFNEAYFGGRLELPIITIADQLAGNAQANCEVYSTPIVINFAESTVADHSRVGLLDILLHEMIHQAIAQHDGPEAAWSADNDGHGARFARIANRIAKQRGWPDCYEHCTHGSQAARFWPPRTHH